MQEDRERHELGDGVEEGEGEVCELGTAEGLEGSCCQSWMYRADEVDTHAKLLTPKSWSWMARLIEKASPHAMTTESSPTVRQVCRGG